MTDGQYTSDYELNATVDDIIDLLYVLFDNPKNKDYSEKTALAWIFSYNTALNAKPVDLISQEKTQVVYHYLFNSAYGDEG